MKRLRTANSLRPICSNFAADLAIVVAALVVFQWNNQRVKRI